MSEMERSESYDSLILFRRGNVVKQRLGGDEVDLGVTRETGELAPARASIVDNFFALLAIATFIADLGTDILVSRQYYKSNDYWWFGWTMVFLILPLVIVQIFSYKWYTEDHAERSLGALTTHVLLIAPVERYLNAFWYGLKTMLSKTVHMGDYERYLIEWRDITMLRLFEAFLESGPQVTLQLYILSSVRPFSWDRDWLTVASALCSIVSLAWAIVSYSHALRYCCRNTGLSIPGYVFQTLYRIFMVSSRVAALVLFATQYKEWIFAFVCFHWGLMTLWLSFHETRFCPGDSERTAQCLEKCFSAVVAVIFIFCFMNVRQGETRCRVTSYYTLFFLENAALTSLWYVKNDFGQYLTIASISVVMGGFFCGLFFMSIYYGCLHPRASVSEACCCCCYKSKEKTRSMTSSEEMIKSNSSRDTMNSGQLWRTSTTDPKRIIECDETQSSIMSQSSNQLSNGSTYHPSDQPLLPAEHHNGYHSTTRRPVSQALVSSYSFSSESQQRSKYNRRSEYYDRHNEVRFQSSALNRQQFHYREQESKMNYNLFDFERELPRDRRALMMTDELSTWVHHSLYDRSHQTSLVPYNLNAAVPYNSRSKGNRRVTLV